jgi:hypothetical protein
VLIIVQSVAVALLLESSTSNFKLDDQDRDCVVEIKRNAVLANLDFSNISVHRGRESEKDVVLQQFL